MQHTVIVMHDAPSTEELDKWMHGPHHEEVLATPGVTGVQRFKVTDGPDDRRGQVSGRPFHICQLLPALSRERILRVVQSTVDPACQYETHPLGERRRVSRRKNNNVQRLRGL